MSTSTQIKSPPTPPNGSPSELSYALSPSTTLTYNKLTSALHFCARATSMTHPYLCASFPRFNGSFKHQGRAEKLVGNLYGTSPAPHIYYKGLCNFLAFHNYEPTTSNPCLFRTKTDNESILIYITIDDLWSPRPLQMTYLKSIAS